MFAFVEDVTTTIAAASGAAIGSASSLYFRANEPRLTTFLVYLSSFALLARLFTVPTWDWSLLYASYVSAGAAVASYLFGLGASILYYRLFSSSHPLHAIPGPLFARASKFWLLSSVLSGNIRDDFDKAHKTYGKVVRIAPNEISIADADAVLPVHGAKSWIRGTSYNATVYSKSRETAENASMLNLVDHVAHAPRRKIWDKAFTIASLRDYEPMVLRRLRQLTSTFDDRQGTVLDLNEWLGFLVFDVTSDLAYGGGTSFIKAGKDQGGVVEGVVASLRLQGRTMAVPWLAGLTAFSPLAKRSVPFMIYAKDRFFERFKTGNPNGGKDFLYHLNNEGSAEGSQVSIPAMASDAALIMAAGADTTRLAISIIFMYMVKDQNLYKKLQAEVDRVLKVTETTEIDGEHFPIHDDIKKIPLLDAYIDEALRLHPPLSIEPMRQAPEGGMFLSGAFIPGGAQVRVPSHVIQRDPVNFERPLEYLPERWLKSENGQVINKAAFFPFLFGPFHCVGKQFAYQEMRLFIATLVWKYDMKFGPNFDPVAWEKKIEDNGTLLEIHDPLQVIMTRRSAKA